MSDTILTFDRSTLEDWATCPQQAWLAARHRTAVGEIAVAGQEVHDAISRTIDTWISSQGMISPQDLVNELELNLVSARPDVQPDVLASMRRSIWTFARWLSDDHFRNILRFDGGEGEKSGQLSHDFEGLGCRVTAELDLLRATPAKAEVEIYDWKSGWAHWTATAVKKSFQFQMQAWLVFENYPDVECVRVTIWNLRENRRTYAVEFFRADKLAIETRVRSAVGYAMQYANATKAPPGWPTAEKCGMCAVAALCNVGDEVLGEIADDPTLWVDRLVALEARMEAISKGLAKVVAERGEDIETASGHYFGTRRPKKATKPAAVLYTKGKGKGDDDAGEMSADNPFAQFKTGKV